MSYQNVLLAQTLRSEDVHPAPSQLCDKRFCLFRQHVCLFSICRVLTMGRHFSRCILKLSSLSFSCACSASVAVFTFGRAADAFLFFSGRAADALIFWLTHVALFPLPGGGVEPSLRRFLRHQLLGLSGHGHCWLLSSVFCGVCLRMGDRR